MPDEKPPPLDRELVHEFVLKAHSDLAAVDAFWSRVRSS